MPTVTSYGRLAKVGAVWGFLSRGMSEIVGVPVAMILARLLTPEDFGIAATAAFFVQMAQRMTNFGFNTALVQLREIRPEHKSTVFCINIVVGVILTIGLIVAAPWCGQFFNNPDAAKAIRVASWTFLIGSLGAVSASLQNRELAFRRIVHIDWLGTWASAIASVALGVLGYGFWSIIYAQVIATVLTTSARLMSVRWWPQVRFSLSALQELFSFGIGLHAKRLLDSTAQNLDNVVIGRTLGLEILGYYDKAFSMMHRSVNLLSAAGPAVSFRILAIVSGHPERFRMASRKVMLLSTFVAYPCFALLIVMAPEVIAVMFGPRWWPAVWPFRVLCIAGALRLFNAFASAATQAVGRVWGEVWRQLVYIGVLIAGVTVGSRFGLTGAAVGVVVATLVMTVAMAGFLAKTTPVSWKDTIETQMPGTACAGMLILVLASLRTLLPEAGADGTAAVMVLAAAAGISAIVVIAFIHVTRFRELRSVCFETACELVPWTTRLLPRPVQDGLTARRPE